jgi:hypothetical protein
MGDEADKAAGQLQPPPVDEAERRNREFTSERLARLRPKDAVKRAAGPGTPPGDDETALGLDRIDKVRRLRKRQRQSAGPAQDGKEDPI